MSHPWSFLRNGAVKATVVAVTLISFAGVATPANASNQLAAGLSPFCSTLLSFHPHAPKNARDWKQYEVFAQSVLPTFERLAATAPNKATKELMTELVAQLKFDSRAASLNQFEGYWNTHLKHWEYDWQQFVSATMTCVKALY